MKCRGARMICVVINVCPIWDYALPQECGVSYNSTLAFT